MITASVKAATPPPLPIGKRHTSRVRGNHERVYCRRLGLYPAAGWLMRNGQCIDKLKLPCGITRLNGQRARSGISQQLAPWRGDRAAGADGGHDRQRCRLATGAVSGLPAALEAPMAVICGGGKSVDYSGAESGAGGRLQRDARRRDAAAGRLATDARGVLRAAGHPLQMGAGADGVVRQFATAMTGELHHLLLNHSLLGQGCRPAAG
jgi:2-dehydro-3-deoxygalactonokinase